MLDELSSVIRSTTVRRLSKLAVAVLALVFVGATVANSNAFADAPAMPGDTVAALSTSPVVETPATAKPTPPAPAASSDPQSQGLVLTLAALACVGFLAGRRVGR